MILATLPMTAAVAVRRLAWTAALTAVGAALMADDLAAAQERERVGQAEIVVSRVRGILGQATRELVIEDNVFSEEVIETGPDAATRLVFLDGTEMSMGPSSRMVLDRYIYDPNAGTGELVMQVVSGVFEFASGAIPSSGYDLRTPFGNLAVRGTRLTFILDTGDKMVVKVEEGEVVTETGESLTSGGCLFFPLPGTGDPFLLSNDDCDQVIGQRVTTMLAMLGVVPDVAPAAGPDLVTPQGEQGDPPVSPTSASED